MIWGTSNRKILQLVNRKFYFFPLIFFLYCASRLQVSCAPLIQVAFALLQVSFAPLQVSFTATAPVGYSVVGYRGALQQVSLVGLFSRSLQQVSLVGLFSRSLQWVSFVGLFSRSLQQVSFVGLFSRSLQQVSLVGLFSKSLQQVSLVGLFCSCRLSWASFAAAGYSRSL